MKIIDANIVLRYLLKDEEKSFTKSSQIIESDNVRLTNEVIAEIVYVLEKVYSVPKVEIADVLSMFVEMVNILIDDKQLILEAFRFYGKHNLDFVDAILLSYNKVRKYKIITFDKKLNKLLINGS
jgi:predicted nucleic-acid-binding protein